MASLPEYAELHCLSNFSFLRGASHPEELVERAAALGYRALAITDECSLAGAVRAHQAAKERGLKLILGTEIVFEKTRLVLLAPDRKAYGAISSLITLGRRRSKKGKYSLSRAMSRRLPAAARSCFWIPERRIEQRNGWQGIFPVTPGSPPSCTAGRTIMRSSRR
jgi:error-prone DNA polymerase